MLILIVLKVLLCFILKAVFLPKTLKCLMFTQILCVQFRIKFKVNYFFIMNTGAVFLRFDAGLPSIFVLLLMIKAMFQQHL